jgi:hypothetical protein
MQDVVCFSPFMHLLVAMAKKIGRKAENAIIIK